MRYKIYTTFLIFINIISPQTALAEDDELFFYVGGKLGFVQQFLNSGTVDIKLGSLLNEKYSSTSDKPAMGIGLMGGVGYTIISEFGIRAELEYIYRPPTEIQTNFFDSSILSTQIYTILANLYLDYNITEDFALYVGGGVGVGIIQPQIQSEPNIFYHFDAQATFAWQAGGGFLYRITDDIFTDIQVRYADFSSYQKSFSKGTAEGNFPLSAVEVFANIGYRF